MYWKRLYCTVVFFSFNWYEYGFSGFEMSTCFWTIRNKLFFFMNRSKVFSEKRFCKIIDHKSLEKMN